MKVILIAAGLSCIAVACIHGYLGQTRLIGPASFQSRQAKALVLLIWQFSAAVWISCGAVIGASPWIFDDKARPIFIMIACLPLIWGMIGNAWVTRGRHFGWKALAVIVFAALVGATY